MPPTRQPPWVSWVAGVAAMAMGAGVVLWLSRPEPRRTPPAPAKTATASWSRLPPGAGIRARMALTATVRWGQTASPHSQPRGAGPAQVWDGWLALDCGEVVDREALGWERAAALPDAATDALGPVVWADDGSQRVYWRSTTSDDWDGVRVRLRACPKGPEREAGSTLRVVTPHRSWSARLGWSQDDFSAIPLGEGLGLEVHIGVDKEPGKVYGARMTAAPAMRKGDFELATEQPGAGEAVEIQ